MYNELQKKGVLSTNSFSLDDNLTDKYLTFIQNIEQPKKNPWSRHFCILHSAVEKKKVAHFNWSFKLIKIDNSLRFYPAHHKVASEANNWGGILKHWHLHEAIMYLWIKSYGNWYYWSYRPYKNYKSYKNCITFPIFYNNCLWQEKFKKPPLGVALKNSWPLNC